MIVSIILSILKIIGIALLCILGLLLLIVLLVLFVPIRYKVTAEGHINQDMTEYHVKAKVTWLLCLVHGKFEYPGEKGFILKIGPFYLSGKEKKPKKPKKEKRKSKSKGADEKEAVYLATGEEGGTDQPDDAGANEKKQDNTEDVVLLEEMLEEKIKKKKERKSFKEKIHYTRQKICDKINEIKDKIKKIFANIKKYISIVKSDEFKNTLALCKTSLVRIFRMIKPRKVRIKGTVGMKSPEQTGYVCAAVGIISPFYKKQIHITPDFENYIIDGNVLIKGRIYLCVVLGIAIKVFFDKNIRKVLEMFRREEA